jgi:hypothetical protein
METEIKESGLDKRSRRETETVQGCEMGNGVRITKYTGRVAASWNSGNVYGGCRRNT